jgi:membrane protease YdiL (CAAX protease family)
VTEITGGEFEARVDAPEPVVGGRSLMAEDTAEAWLVLWICVGLTTVSSVYRLYLDHGLVRPFDISRLSFVLVQEGLLVVAFVPFLRLRGWTLSRASVPFAAPDLFRGVVIWCVLYVVYWVTVMFMRASGLGDAAMHMKSSGQAPWLIVLLVSLLNPIFEEFLYLGYAVNALRRHGVAVAATTSIALRVAVHLYQGPAALTYIAPFGLVLTTYYIKTRRIWPVIIAHAIQDAIGLTLQMHAAR